MQVNPNGAWDLASDVLTACVLFGSVSCKGIGHYP